MKRFATVGFLTSSAVAALFAAASMALSGCVTEEVPPTEIHTSAYLVPDADSAATGDLPAHRSEGAATSGASSSTSQANSSQATSSAAAAAPMVPPPVAALPPPPVAALPPPPIPIP